MTSGVGSSKSRTRSFRKGRATSLGALSLLAILAAILLQAGGASATPNVFSFDRLRLGSAQGPENYVFTTGNVIYPDAGVDPGTFYKVVVTDSSGVVRNPGFACTGAASFPVTNNTYTVTPNDPPSAGAAWKYTLNQYNNSNCTGTAAKTTFKVLYVAKATAYADANLTITKSTFNAGEPVYLGVQGVPPGTDNWSTTWILPSAATACANTAGADRPASSGSGRLPKGTTNYLLYRPVTTPGGNQWNREPNYEVVPCVSTSSANQGLWDLRLDFDATDFVTVAAFTVDTTAPPSPSIDSAPSDPSNSQAASFGFSDTEAGVSFLCQLDGGGFSACTSPRSYAGLADGSHTFQVKARDAAGNDSPPASRTWTVDTAAPPSPSIDSAPADPSNSQAASFGFSDTEAGVSFLCQLDGGGYGACTSPKSYSGLADGSHSFQVKARDAAGNQSAATSRSWTIDTTAPPSPLIDSAPSDPSNTQAASFGFSDTEAGVSFLCQLDGGGYGACTSPQSYDGLAESSHTFQVKARDAAGNESTAATFSWTIDLPSPVTLGTPADGSAIADSTPSFSGTAGTDPGDSPMVTVNVYAGPDTSGALVQSLIAFVDPTGAFAVDALVPLSDGQYTARAEQADGLGNTGFSSANTFTVDTQAPPDPSIDSAPSDPSNSQAASFGFSDTEAGVTFLCQLDGAGFSACASPQGYSGLTDGSHSFQVKARDAAGNESAAVGHSWTVDTTAPPSPSIDSAPADPSASQAASFHFSDTEAGVTFLCRLDGGGYGACTSPQDYSGLADGSHSFQVKARDAAGNESPATSHSWTIDTTAPPSPSIDSAPADPSNTQAASFGFSDAESGVTFLCQLDGGGYGACTSPKNYSGLADGSHTFQVKAHDAAGNESAATGRTWTVDTQPPPDPSIDSTPSDPSGSQAASFGFSDTESGVSFFCQLDGGGYGACSSPKNYSGLAEGPHSFQVKAVDAAGNESAAVGYSWTIELGAPQVTLDTPANGSTTNDAAVTFSGSAGNAAGDSELVTLKVYAGFFPSGTPVQTLFANRTQGAWSASASPPLADGTYTAQAEQSDEANNTGFSSANTFTVDTQAPPTPSIDSAPTDPSNSQAASFGFSNSENGVAFLCQLDGGGYGACASPKNYSGLAEGAHSFQVKARDAAGNESAPAGSTWTIDTTAPVVTLTTPANGSATNNTTPTLSGAAGTATGDSATITVKVYSGSSPTGTPVRTMTTTRSGASWSVAASPALADGTYTARAEQADAAGNTGLSSANTFVVDTAAPVITLTAPANNSTTSDPTPTLSGTAGTAPRDSGSVTVKVYSGGTPTGTPLQTLSANVQAGGAYSVDAAALNAGTYTARAEQSDTAGNTGLSSANTFTVQDPVLIGAGDIASCEGGDGDAATATVINNNPNATVFTLGDTAYSNGTASEFTNCYNPTWGQFKQRTRPMVGDHEYGTANASGYFNYFQSQLAPFGPAATDPLRGYYSYDLGAWHVVVLNSSCYIDSIACNESQMEQWFTDDLAAHPNSCTLAMWHEPRYSSGNVHGNNPEMQALWQTAYSNGVDVVLSGHEHDYERYAPMDAAGNSDPTHGVREFVVGTGGYFRYGLGTLQPNSQVYNSTTWGVLKLTLHASSYDWQFLPAGGGTFTDSGTTACHPPAPPPPPGAPTVRSVGTGTSNGPATTLTVPKPNGTTEGDLLVAFAANMNGASRNMTAPAGWTAVPNTEVFNGTGVRTHSWYHVAGASEPSSYVFTETGGSAYDMSGGIAAITGASPSAPINASAAQSNGTTASTSVNAPSVTTTVGNSLLLYGGACNVSITFTPPVSMIERWDLASTGTYRVTTELASQPLPAAGATGIKTAIASGACFSAGASIAIAPSN